MPRKVDRVHFQDHIRYKKKPCVWHYTLACHSGSSVYSFHCHSPTGRVSSRVVILQMEYNGITACIDSYTNQSVCIGLFPWLNYSVNPWLSLCVCFITVGNRGVRWILDCVKRFIDFRSCSTLRTGLLLLLFFFYLDVDTVLVE